MKLLLIRFGWFCRVLPPRQRFFALARPRSQHPKDPEELSEEASLLELWSPRPTQLVALRSDKVLPRSSCCSIPSQSTSCTSFLILSTSGSYRSQQVPSRRSSSFGGDIAKTRLEIAEMQNRDAYVRDHYPYILDDRQANNNSLPSRQVLMTPAERRIISLVAFRLKKRSLFQSLPHASATDLIAVVVCESQNILPTTRS